MERATNEGGEGAGLDLSALLGSLMPEGQGPGEGLDFAALLGMLGGLGGTEEKPPPSPPPGGNADGLPALDPALFATFHRAMKAMREPDRNITLLQALRPFLEPERQKKVDEAIKFLHLMKLAPLLQGLPLGDGA